MNGIGDFMSGLATTMTPSSPAPTNNTPSNTSTIKPRYNPTCVYPSTASVFILGTMGFVGNTLLLCVMKRPHLKNKSYAHFLSALAISDNFNILFMMFHLVNYIAYMNTEKYLTSYFTDVGCKIFDFIERIFMFNSAWLIVCITIERFLVIYFPCRGRIFCRAKKALALVIVVSSISCASQSLRMLWVIRDNQGLCSFHSKSVAVASHFDIITALILFYVAPSFTIFLLNVLTLIRMNGFIRSNSSTAVTSFAQNSTVVGSVTGTNGCGRNGRGSFRNSGYYAPGLDNGDSVGTPVENTQQHLLPVGRENCTTSTTSGTGQGNGTQQLLLRYFPRLRRNSRRATWILLTISFTYIICCLPNLIGELYWHLRILVFQNLGEDMQAFLQYFACYTHVLKIFKTINYGSNFYTYILFGKSFRKEVTTLLNFSSSSGGGPCVIGHHQPKPPADPPVVMMRVPGAPGNGGIEAPPPDILLFNKLKSPHVPLAEYHNKHAMLPPDHEKQNLQRYRNMPEFPI